MRLEDFYTGNGSIRNTKSGKRELNITFINEDGEKKNKSFTGESDFDCYTRALKFAEKYSEQKSDEESTIPDILKARFDKDLKMNFLKEQSYYRKMETLKIIEDNSIGKLPIKYITKQHINAFLGEITKYANSTIEKIFLQLKIAFSVAVDENIISKDIMQSHDIKRPKSSKADKRIRALTEDEQKLLVKELINGSAPDGRNEYRLQLLIALYSGMRMGEVNALSPSDIDFKNKVIHVKKTISMGKNGRGFLGSSTKTYAGIRDIPISKMLEPVLKEAVERMKKNKENLVFYDNSNDWVITTSNVNSFYKRVCDKIGIECNGQHSLRHTFATRCIEAGVPAVVLKKWLGHTDIHVTLDTYADVFDKMNNNAIEAFDKYLDLIEQKEFQNV